jgi:hypothetical protein
MQKLKLALFTLLGIQKPKPKRKRNVAAKKPKPVWDKKRPKDVGKPKALTSKQKTKAKAAAKKAGRPYPNMVDNINAAKKTSGAKKRG